MAAKTFATHECAALFPLMSDEEYEGLKADIAQHGQREPIILCGGKILDGRNRYRACRELGIAAKTRDLPAKESPSAFVVSANLHRRHLTASQKSMASTDYEEMAAKEAKQRQRAGGGDKKSQEARGKSVPEKIPEALSNGEAREQTAKLFGVNPHYVTDAKAIKKADPVLAEKVRSGEVTLQQAKRQIKPPTMPQPVPISKTFGDHLSEIRQVLSGIRDQYGDGEKMLASDLWRDCDTEYAIEMTRMLAELLTTLHKEMLAHVRKTKKAKSA